MVRHHDSTAAVLRSRAPPAGHRTGGRELISRADCPRRRIKAPSRVIDVRKPVEEVQELSSGDQVGGGRREGEPISEGRKAALDGVCVSI